MTCRQINDVERAPIGKVCSDSFLRLNKTFSRVYCFQFLFLNVEIKMFFLNIEAKSKILWVLCDKQLRWKLWSRSDSTVTSFLFKGFAKTISAVCNNIEAKFEEQFVEVSFHLYCQNHLFHFKTSFVYCYFPKLLSYAYLYNRNRCFFRTVTAHVRWW